MPNRLKTNIPEILAPAGNQNTFLAAIAAGADAIYCGLKIFSARMEADNFSIETLSRLSKLAGSKNVKVYVAFNSIVKESELEKVYKILSKLVRYVPFDALIIQDPAVIDIAKKAGFNKEFHLSTLANCTSPAGLTTAKSLGFSKVVLPREFTIDEIKEMTRQIPEGMTLETFIHGALCYCVSGRCYWSSWFGGKSSLRGRCVQPCRRIYDQKGKQKQFFSCLDFSNDVLAKVLKQIQKVNTWKIEGRKKGPHYVYYTVKAYKLLRDHPEEKKQALYFLEYAMGRQSTHYNLLSQRKINPLDHTSQTGSGLFAGRIKNPTAPYFITRESLLVDDLLRIGTESDAFHTIEKVTRAIPKKGRYILKKGKSRIKKGAPVYIIDRRGSELTQALEQLSAELDTIPKINVTPEKKKISFQPPGTNRQDQKRSVLKHPVHLLLFRKSDGPLKKNSLKGAWISARGYSQRYPADTWRWLDPVLFPEEEKKCARSVHAAIGKGAKNFVLNTPWQISLFQHPEKLNLWAGPFCNITNSVLLNQLKNMGFSGAIVSPEMDKQSFLSLPKTTPLPLGVVIYGNWPLGISRIVADDLKINHAFRSPRGETAWVSKQSNNYFIFPNWRLDLNEHKALLKKAGYRLFVHMNENIPKSIQMKNRPGFWNWHLTLY